MSTLQIVRTLISNMKIEAAIELESPISDVVEVGSYNRGTTYKDGDFDFSQEFSSNGKSVFIYYSCLSGDTYSSKVYDLD